MAIPNWVSEPYVPGTVRPEDWLLEIVSETTDGSGDSSITLLTDTTHIDVVKFAVAVPVDSSPTATNVATVGASLAFKGEASKAHRVYIFGGNKGVGQACVLSSSRNPARKGSLYWTLKAAVSASGNAYTVTSATELITKAEVVIPVSTVTAAGTANARATGVSAMVAATSTVSTAGATDTATTIVAGTLDDFVSDNETDKVYVLPAALPGVVQPGDLVCEVVTKTMSSASPSTVTLTASSDCTFVDIIAAVIPVNTGATPGSVAAVVAAGGATCVLYGANTTTDDIRCLVIGYAL